MGSTLEINGIRLTDGSKTEIVDLFLKALSKENLMQRTIAEKLDISAGELSWMKSKSNWRWVKDSTWFKFMEWRRSGLTLSEYIHRNNGKKVEEITTDNLPEKNDGPSEKLIEAAKDLREKLTEKTQASNPLLEKEALLFPNQQAVDDLEAFKKRMELCWDELEERNGVIAFLRKRGYHGKLSKIITQTVTYEI